MHASDHADAATYKNGHPASEAQAASHGNGEHADMDENEEEGVLSPKGDVVSIILSRVCWLTNASPADLVNAASNENGHPAPEDVAAADGSVEHADMDEDQEDGSSEGDPEEAGEETEISDFDEQAHDGEPASSGGAGNGSGLRPSYGRKVGSLSSLDPAVAKGSDFCGLHYQHHAPKDVMMMMIITHMRASQPAWRIVHGLQDGFNMLLQMGQPAPQLWLGMMYLVPHTSLHNASPCKPVYLLPIFRHVSHGSPLSCNAFCHNMPSCALALQMYWPARTAGLS